MVRYIYKRISISFLLDYLYNYANFVVSLWKFRNIDWPQYHSYEKNYMKYKIAIQCSMLIIVSICYVCLFTQIALISAKLDGFFQSVSWHYMFIPIYLLIGIEYCILCIITPIIELIVFKNSEEKSYNFFTAEIYRYIIVAQSLCITLPLIAFLILLGLKLDGLT